jgi:methionyl-tRNA formyltransferase
VRVVFFGTPEFAVPTLEALVEAGHEVALVVAQPDKPAGRGQQLTAPPVARRAAALGLPLAQPLAIKTGAFPERLEALKADVAVVIAYGRILTRRLLDAPRLGCVNVHASLLPRWRGAAPIQAAVLAGDAVTGVCTQRMEEGLDTGPVYVEKATPIGPHETAGALHDRLAVLSAACALETLPLLGHVTPRPQDEALATYAGKIGKDDGLIAWDAPAVVSDRRVRAMTPWPGGQVAHQGTQDGGRLKLLEVRPVDGHGRPGTVLSTSPLVVACGVGALELVRVQAPGRKPVRGTDLANGLRLQPGDTL